MASYSGTLSAIGMVRNWELLSGEIYHEIMLCCGTGMVQLVTSVGVAHKGTTGTSFL